VKVRIGVGTAGFSFDEPRDFFAFAERCEAAGVDSLWQSDRLIGADPQLAPMAATAAPPGPTRRRRTCRT